MAGYGKGGLQQGGMAGSMGYGMGGMGNFWGMAGLQGSWGSSPGSGVLKLAFFGCVMQCVLSAMNVNDLCHD